MLSDRDRAIRDGIESVRENEVEEWKERYYQVAAQFLTNNQFFEGGQICAQCRTENIGEPHHHNVWGSMLTTLRKHGWAEKVGYVTPTTVQTHIDKVVLWKSLIFVPDEEDTHDEVIEAGIEDEERVQRSA